MFFKSTRSKDGAGHEAGASTAAKGNSPASAMARSVNNDRAQQPDTSDGQSTRPTESRATAPAPERASVRATHAPEELKRRAAVARRASAHFGQIVSVLMRSDQLKRMTLEDLEHVVVPAVATGQFLVAEAQSAANGLTAPVGVVLWATVSDAVDQRLSSALERPLRLARSEWTSGENAWLVVAAGEARVVSGMLKRLQTMILKGRPLKAVSRDQSGQPSLKVWPAA